MRVMPEPGQAWIFDRPQSAARFGGAINRERAPSTASEVRLRYERVMACAKEDGVIVWHEGSCVRLKVGEEFGRGTALFNALAGQTTE
jgi:hypothetical protein